MNKCLSLVEARHWAEQGTLQPVPDGLRSHADRCDLCAEFIQTVDRARSLGQQLPTTPLGQERHDALRFRADGISAPRSEPLAGGQTAPCELARGCSLQLSS